MVPVHEGGREKLDINIFCVYVCMLEWNMKVDEVILVL